MLELSMPAFLAWLKNRAGKHALTAVLSAAFTLIYFACGFFLFAVFCIGGGVFCALASMALALVSLAPLCKIFKNILRGGEVGELKTAVAQWFAMLCIASLLVMFFGDFSK